MEISKVSNSQSFGMKLKNNQAFRDIVDYAVQTRQIKKLDEALNALSHTHQEDVLTIMHGSTPAGLTFSNFSVGKKCLPNRTNGLKPAAASFEALMRLVEIGSAELKKLTGTAAHYKYMLSDFFTKYSV